MDDLSERAERAAAESTCTRCGNYMIQERGVGRLTTGTYKRIGQRCTDHFNLCATCGPAFRLFLAESR